MHVIDFLEDEAMPSGHDFMLIRLGPDDMHLFIRHSVMTDREKGERVLEDAWEAYRKERSYVDPQPPARVPLRAVETPARPIRHVSPSVARRVSERYLALVG